MNRKFAIVFDFLSLVAWLTMITILVIKVSAWFWLLLLLFGFSTKEWFKEDKKDVPKRQ